MKKLIFDIEVYKNYTLFSFSNLDLTKFVEIEMYEGQPLDIERLRKVLTKYLIITFNGNHFDMPITFAALNGADCAQLKKICDSIIKRSERGWQTIRRFDIPSVRVNHIDLMEPTPGVRVSLKLYGGRLNCPKLQDLPIEPDALITPEQREELRLYCRNDLETTRDLFLAVENEIDLRQEMGKEYGVDLRSMSGAQVAKAVFKKLLNDEGIDTTTVSVDEGTKYKYDMPSWISFDTPELNEVKCLVEKSNFVVNDKGSVLIPSELLKVIKFDGAKYKIGIGGLHSQEKAQAIVAGEDELLWEGDVSSYYPATILGQSLYPEHLGPKFIDVYKGIVKRRLEAKRSGDKETSESLKLVINSSFGLFGNRYAFLYSPQLLIQVTITGQLCLLMLIEKVVAAGGRVVSANTDGINVLCKKADYDAVNYACDEWEFTTGFELEENPYKATYNESVNSYVAIKRDGSVKSKGSLALPGLMKNTVNTICIEAVINYLSNKTPIAKTINHCNDITKFLTVRTVNGGGVQGDEYLGKVVRWYYGDGDTTINYKKNGNKVPKSDGAIPAMDLPDEFPKDLNRTWYVIESLKMLENLGVKV